jgi:hypothetical protein
MINKQEIEAQIARYENVLAKSTDEMERGTIQGVIDKLKKQVEIIEEEPAAEVVEKPKKEKVQKPAKEKVEKKKPVAKKAKKAKEAKKASKLSDLTKSRSALLPSKKEKKAKSPKPEKKVEKTVKISKVMPVEEKKNVEDILESEHYKVIFKQVGGKKIKITVKNSDRVVAKNKVDSAFTTIAKKVVDSEEERKKYADDIKALDSMKGIVAELIENIYKAFNAHKTDQLKSLLKKLKTI